jgi:hypothetical protein
VGGNEMITPNISDLFNKNLWEQIANEFSPENVAKTLTFKDALRVAYRLLYNDQWNEDLQYYAIDLLNVIRNVYPNEWNSNWQYDALLGLACRITNRYDEKYEAYKRAFDKANPKPARLLIELARCCDCPGTPPISYEKAIALLNEVLKKHMYGDAVGLISSVYSLKNDEENKVYWSEILAKIIAENGEDSPSIEPEFLVKDYEESETKKRNRLNIE